MKLTSVLTAICAVVLFEHSIAQEGADCVSFPVGSENEAKGPGAPSQLSAVSFQEIGSPPGGYPSVTDMVTFNGKMYLATSKNPLADFGTNVFYTTDGLSYTKVLEDVTSQGYLRLGVFDSKLWIPDGDPNGLDPSFVYISSTGAPSSFTQTQIIGAVHSFDVVKYNNQFYVSNGMGAGNGGLCKYNGTSTWNQVYASSSSIRMKYMGVVNGKLVVANKNTGSDVDAFVFSGDPATTTPASINPLSGATNTFRMYVSTTGKLFWSIAAGSTIRVLMTTDGTNWQQCSTLDGKMVSDFAEFNGKLYAVATNGLWESSDFFTFANIAPPPTSDPNAFVPAAVGPGVNPDSPASLESYGGYLWAGSARNGKIYKVDFGTTSVPETIGTSAHYQLTDHSIIFQMENQASAGLRVYNLTGSLVKTVSLGTVSQGNYEIQLGDLKQGVYLLEAMVGDEVKGIKFVK